MSTNYDETIGYFSTYSNRKMIRYLSLQLEEYDITLEQWTILAKLPEQQAVNQKQLSVLVDKDPTTLVRILDILERKQLVRRRVSQEDRRAFLILITDKGKVLKKQLTPVIEATFLRILDDISTEKLQIFHEVLSKMNQNIENAVTNISLNLQ